MEELPLILASGSPRRAELLQTFHIPFTVVVENIDETPYADESAEAMTIRLAAQKAQAVSTVSTPPFCILAGDTTVSLDNKILGKPENKADAISMLERLSGKTHQVYTAMTLIHNGQSSHCLSLSHVTFDELTTHQIDAFTNTSEPFDKAGAYGIQGYAGRFVGHIEGSYSGIVGLPLRETYQLLQPIYFPQDLSQ